MSDKHAQFVGSIPERYDTCLGPFLFEFSAKDLAERVKEQVAKSSEVLEVACGTGISTEYLRHSLPADVTIMATDLNEAMLELAREKRGTLQGVTYRTADALALPFEDGRFDAVVCQFGIMFFPDKLEGLTQMARVTKPSGFLAFNVWDSTERNQVVAVVQGIVASFFETDPPTFLDTPFGFYDVDYIKKLMGIAGFTELRSHIVSTTIEDLSAHHIAQGLVEGNPTISEIRERASVDAEEIIKAAANAIEEAFGYGKPKIPLQEIVFTGIKPGLVSS